MTRPVRCFLLMAALGACDDTAQPRPSQPDGAIAPDGGEAGAGGGGGAGGSGGSCSATPPPLSPSTLPAAVLGELYSQKLSIVGSTASKVIWTTRGAPPTGLKLVEDDTELAGPPPEAHATLSGTPSAPGSFRFTVAVSLLVQPSCATPPAERDYELLISDDDDAGVP
jgi:hypothetical protein